MNDAEIIAQVQAGDTDRFGVLYDAYFPRIYAYLFYRTHDRAVAEDLVSATFFKAIEGIHTFTSRKGTFSAWLYRIARNTLYDHSRRRANAKNLPLEDAERTPGSGDVEKEVADRDLLRKVSAVLGTLSPVQREVVVLRAWDGLSYKEIAEILDKSEASCKVAFSRAAGNFRSTLL